MKSYRQEKKIHIYLLRLTLLQRSQMRTAQVLSDTQFSSLNKKLKNLNSQAQLCFSFLP